MTELTKILNNPEEHYPGNFDTPQRANALLTGLCQDAATEIAKLQYEVDAIPAIKEERDALAAELTRLKASIALDKMAENARDLGLDYEPAVQEPVFCEYCGGNDDADFGLPTDHCTDCARPQPDYAWPTIEDYEKEVGFEVNIAFRSAWAMARTTNDLFKQMGETK